MTAQGALAPDPQWPVSDLTRIRIGRVAMAGSILVAVVGVTFTLAVGSSWSFLIESFSLIMAVSAIGLGALCWVMVGAQPRNGAVWVLTWAAFFGALHVVGHSFEAWQVRNLPGVADVDHLTPADVPLGIALGLWVSDWPPFIVFFLPLTLGLLLFPDGRLPSRGWRWVGWASIAAMATIALPIMWVKAPTASYTYGYDDEGSIQPEIATQLVDGGFLGSVLCSSACLAALLVRYRRTDPETRQQIRLGVIGFLGFLGFSMASAILDARTGEGLNSSDTPLLEWLFPLTGQLVLMAAFAVAILRFRLYEIDVVISKALTSLALAGFVSSLYVGLVVGIGGLVGGRSSFLLSIVVTTAVAILFQPVRRIVHRAADRLIYGDRASPYESLAQFGRRATEVSDGELVERVPRLVVESTSAGRAALWLETDGAFVKTASWPDEVGVWHQIPAGTASDRAFVDPDADRSFPIVHDGEVLGGISVVAGRGERMTASDEQVVANLASALGLALRNARLTARLRGRIADLEASRERIQSAADDARRSLERQLERGPLQQLTGLQAGLAEALVEASTDGLEPMANLLARLEADADNAWIAVVDFARGVYPPRLEADGLVVAIAEQAEMGALPIAVQDGTVRRYGREVESAVYFTVLEALQNTTKHAEAGSARVVLGEQDGVLTFQITDDGCGFDPASVPKGAGLGGLADRMDTVGGTVDLQSAPGLGTTVRGSVAVGAPRTELVRTGARGPIA